VIFTRYQQIAMANEETGELLCERRLDHEYAAEEEKKHRGSIDTV
jgi:hypothetical protein